MTDPPPKCRAQDPDTDVRRLCVREAGHAGLHSWSVEIDMEGLLPVCGRCGKKAARCGCPIVVRALTAAEVVEYHRVLPRSDVPYAYAPGRGPVTATDTVRRCPRDPGTDNPRCYTCNLIHHERALARGVPPDRRACVVHGWVRAAGCAPCDAAHASFDTTVVTAVALPAPPEAGRPWCPGHGRTRDGACRICDRVWREALTGETPLPDNGGA